MKQFTFILAFFIVTINILLAQNQANIWYFGQFAGLDFNSGTPRVLNNGALNTDEGCATISNAFGQLMFYTDGMTVWNRRHLPMPNGSDLMGNRSSTQSAVAVPKPGNDSIYYLFTVDNYAGPNGFRYSVIDMSRDNGNGVVIDKNILLFAPSTEKVTAVRHWNNTDVWVIAHEWESNAFRSYLVTKDGVSNTPVISNIGSIHEGEPGNTIGYMKVSPDGSKIALAQYKTTRFELFRFNAGTGVVSSPIVLEDSSYVSPYGVEFSPDGRKLYIGNFGSPSRVRQVDVEVYDPDIIKYSVMNISKNRKGLGYGALQVAPDGKIYIAQSNSETIACIRNPNELGMGCKFAEDWINLGDGLSKSGLPTFIQSYYDKCDETTFEFKDFWDTRKLHFTGSAAQKDSVLRLTKTIPATYGAVWYKDKLPVKNGFTTNFKFCMTNGYNDYDDGSLPGADGIAFVIQNLGLNAAGQEGGGIGYANISNSLAIEFDTYKNVLLYDSNGNHIAVFSNSKTMNSSDHGSKANLGTSFKVITMKADSTIYYAKIDLNVKPNTLRVFIDTTDSFGDAVLEVDSVDLSRLLALENGYKAWVGFTSATGTSWENHYLISWDMCPTPVWGITDYQENYNLEIHNIVTAEYPNPFPDKIIINYIFEESSNVNLTIYDIYGRECSELVNEFQNPGEHSIQWDSGNFSSGVYYYVLRIGNKVIKKYFIKVN